MRVVLSALMTLYPAFQALRVNTLKSCDFIQKTRSAKGNLISCSKRDLFLCCHLHLQLWKPRRVALIQTDSNLIFSISNATPEGCLPPFEGLKNTQQGKRRMSGICTRVGVLVRSPDICTEEIIPNSRR